MLGSGRLIGPTLAANRRQIGLSAHGSHKREPYTTNKPKNVRNYPECKGGGGDVREGCRGETEDLMGRRETLALKETGATVSAGVCLWFPFSKQQGLCGDSTVNDLTYKVLKHAGAQQTLLLFWGKLKGFQGAPGIRGPQGEEGSSGFHGFPGLKGQPGPKGIQVGVPPVISHPQISSTKRLYCTPFVLNPPPPTPPPPTCLYLLFSELILKVTNHYLVQACEGATIVSPSAALHSRETDLYFDQGEDGEEGPRGKAGPTGLKGALGGAYVSDGQIQGAEGTAPASHTPTHAHTPVLIHLSAHLAEHITIITLPDLKTTVASHSGNSRSDRTTWAGWYTRDSGSARASWDRGTRRKAWYTGPYRCSGTPRK
ncbi:hypothetical protein JZ751_028914 [Albula glossodonta]|uniref:Uncharacterized protein n=1 Tax=Albula glossodonta TaxID=121402 RepID=A0A8T2NBZ0_9TELE|nr:hypothetical protein JZ751_028914 [Albula glossodonta]